MKIRKSQVNLYVYVHLIHQRRVEFIQKTRFSSSLLHVIKIYFNKLKRWINTSWLLQFKHTVSWQQAWLHPSNLTETHWYAMRVLWEHTAERKQMKQESNCAKFAGNITIASSWSGSHKISQFAFSTCHNEMFFPSWAYCSAVITEQHGGSQWW